MTPMDAERLRSSREKTARRAAERQGLRLEKSRQRDKRGLLYGTFQLIDARSGQVYASGEGATEFGLSLEEIESILDRGRHA
jgi:hypothetical protein